MFDPPEDPTYGQIPPAIQGYLKMPGVNQEKALAWFNLGLSEPQTFNQAILLAQAVGYTPEQSKVVAAQWQKESGGGAHVGASYNYFGIKAHNQAVRDALTARGINVGAGEATGTTEIEGGKAKSQQSSFMQFNNAFEAFAGHKAFLETNQRYQGALGAETAKDFAIGLQKAGYATDPNYGVSLYNDYVAPKERNPASGDTRPKSLGATTSSKNAPAVKMNVVEDTAPMALPIIQPQEIMERPEFSLDPTIVPSQYGATEFEQKVVPTEAIPMNAPAGYFGSEKTGFKMGGHMYPYGGSLSAAQLLQQATGKDDPVATANRKLSLAKVKRNNTLLNPNAWRFEYSPTSFNYSDFIGSLGHEARAFTPNLFPDVSGKKSSRIDATFPLSFRAFQDYTDNSNAYSRNPDRFENAGEYINLGTDPATHMSNYTPYIRGVRDKNLGVEGKIGFHGLMGSDPNVGPSGTAFLDAYGGYNKREGVNAGIDLGAKFNYGIEEKKWMPKGRLNTQFGVSWPWHLRQKEPYYMLQEYAPNLTIEQLNSPGGYNNFKDIYKQTDSAGGNFMMGPKLAGQIQYTQKHGPLTGLTAGVRGDVMFDILNGKYTYNRTKNAYNPGAGGGANAGMAGAVNTEKVDVTGVKQVPYINSQFYLNYPMAGAAAHMNVAKAKVNAQKAKDDEIFKQAQVNAPMTTTPMTNTQTQGVDFNPQEKPEQTGFPTGALPGFNPETGAKVGEEFTQERYSQGPRLEYGGQLGTNMTNMYKKGGMPYAMGGNMYAEGGSFDNPGFNALPVNVQNKIRANSFAVGGGLGSPGNPMLPASAQNILNNPPNFGEMPMPTPQKQGNVFSNLIIPAGSEQMVADLRDERRADRKEFYQSPDVSFGKKLGIAGQVAVDAIPRGLGWLKHPFESDRRQVNRLTRNIYPANIPNFYQNHPDHSPRSFADGGPLTEFNAGGTHEQNPLGGIPQGMAPDGRPNLVEQGETKLDSANYIFSDNIKVTKETAAEFNLPKSAIGKTFADVSKLSNRPKSRRETDTIENAAKSRELDALMQAQETQKEMELQKDIQMMAEKHPQFMQSLMQQQQSVQPMGMPQAPPPEAMAEQIPPEGMPMDPNQIPPEMLAQMEGAQQGMPVMRMGGGMYKCGGKMYNFGGSMYANGGHMYYPGGPLLGGATTGNGYTSGYMPTGSSGLDNPYANNNTNALYNMMNPSGSVNPLNDLTATPNPTPTIGVQGEGSGLAGNMGKGMGYATAIGQGAMQAYGTSQQEGLSDRQKAEQYSQTGVDTAMGIVGTAVPIVGAAYGIGRGIGGMFDKIGEGGDEIVTSADGKTSAVRHKKEGAQVTGDVLSNMFNPSQNVSQGMGYLADKDYKKAAMTFLAPLGGAQIARSLERKEDNLKADQIERMNRGPQVSTLGMPVGDYPVTEDQMPLEHRYGGSMGAHSYRQAGTMDVKDNYDNPGKAGGDNGDPNNYLNTDLTSTQRDLRSVAPFGSGIADLAPMAYNLYQGLSPYDEVSPEDLYSPMQATRPDYSQAENQARQSYARMVNALGASGASGGQRLAGQLAGSQAMSSDLMNVMSAEENAYRQSLAEANKYNAAAKSQAMMGAMDANWKMKAAKQESLKEAISAPKDKMDQMRRDALALQYAQLGAPDISKFSQVGEIPFMQFALDKYKQKKASKAPKKSE